MGGGVEFGADHRLVEFGPHVARDLEGLGDQLLTQVRDCLDGAVTRMPGGAVGESESHTRPTDRLDRAAELLARDPETDPVADRVAILQQHEQPGQPVLDQRLAADGDAGADEPGRRHEHHRVDADDLGDRQDGDDRHADARDSRQHVGGGVRSLPTPELDVVAVVGAGESESPAALSVERPAHRTAGEVAQPEPDEGVEQHRTGQDDRHLGDPDDQVRQVDVLEDDHARHAIASGPRVHGADRAVRPTAKVTVTLCHRKVAA